MSAVVDAEIVDAAWAVGRAAHPGVDVARDRFAVHVEIAAVDEAALARHGADLYLACACVDGAPNAIAWFDEHLLGPAAGVVRTIDASPTFLDEVKQRMRESLLVGGASLASYAGRGPLRAWIGVGAVRTALMMKRSAQRKREVPEEDLANALAMASTGNPELDAIKRQYAAAFGEALRDACRALEPRLRAVLRMHFAEGLSIDEIGAVYSVHRATAARWVNRASDELFDGTRGHLASRLALGATELDGIAAMVRSQLDVSLSQLLG